MTSPNNLLNKQNDDAPQQKHESIKPEHEHEHDSLDSFFKLLSVLGIVSLAGIVIWYIVSTYIAKNSKYVVSAEFLICGG